MRQPMQRAHAIFIKRLHGVIEKAFDAVLEIVHRRINQRDDQYFLPVLQLVIVNDLRRERRENVRLARARYSGNTKPPATVAEDVLLGGSRGEGQIDL